MPSMQRLWRRQVMGRRRYERGSVLRQHFPEQRQPPQSVAYRPHLPGGGLLQGEAGGEALQIPHSLEGLTPPLPEHAFFFEKVHRIQTGFDALPVYEGLA